ncbi:MAG: DsbA family protein [Gemmatimonadales bacterium]
MAVGCAVVSTGIAVKREVIDRRAELSRVQRPDPAPVRDWQKYAVGGHRLGATNPRVTIVEFADFECPYCRRLALGPLRYVLAIHPDVAVLVRQRPMPYHRFAVPAARAAECASAQGQYDDYYNALFVGQDSLGLKSFADFARDAGIADLRAFAACDSASSPVAGMASDMDAANTLGANVTPALIVDGLLISGAPDSVQLEKYVTAALRHHGGQGN